MKERRQSFVADAEKFSTQRNVTYFLLLLFAAVSAAVFYANDQAERSMILQTIINFTMLAIGFWLGTSKGSADKEASMSRIAEATSPIPANVETVNVAAQQANVTEAKQ